MSKILILLILLAAGYSEPGLAQKYDPTTLVFPTRAHAPIRKATKFHLFLYVQNRVKVSNPQGIAATRLASWENPNSKKDDDLVTVYGVNSGQNAIIFNTSMTTISIYGLNERSEGRLNAPRGIAAAPWGDVYVADTGNNRVVKLFNPARELRFVKAIGAGNFSRPTDVALVADSSLYVSDSGNNRLLKLRSDTLHTMIAPPGREDGKVWQPSGVAANASNDPWSFYRDAFVVVVDLNGMRLQRFSDTGKLEAAVHTESFGFPEAELHSIAIDYYSNIWVTDRRNHCIHKFDRELNYLTTFGRRGSGDKEFIDPRGITIYKRFGQVFIAEKESAQYYWIGTDVREFRASPDGNGFIDISFFLTERSHVTLEVYDGRGKLLATPLNGVRRNAGDNMEKLAGEWRVLPFIYSNVQRNYDKTAMQSAPKVAPGTYRFRLTIAPTYSSFTYFKKDVEERVVIR